MKATLPNGTVLEGTPDEVGQALRALNGPQQMQNTAAPAPTGWWFYYPVVNPQRWEWPTQVICGGTVGQNGGVVVYSATPRDPVAMAGS